MAGIGFYFQLVMDGMTWMEDLGKEMDHLRFNSL
jgi:hypothetical protein